MLTVIYTARGRWSVPYKGYFEDGHKRSTFRFKGRR
jgi:hypothetical protein